MAVMQVCLDNYKIQHNSSNQTIKVKMRQLRLRINLLQMALSVQESILNAKITIAGFAIMGQAANISIAKSQSLW